MYHKKGSKKLSGQNPEHCKTMQNCWNEIADFHDHKM